jgi:uncharacterized membrane protein
MILEIIGTLFIIFLGTALHFTFASSGNNPIVGAFSAVNESVWEHLKLPFWPSILWLLLTMYPLRKTVSNIFSSKTIGIILMIMIIPAAFYSYTAFTEEILIVDIATFMIAVIIGQLASYKLYKQANRSKLTEIIAIVVMTFLAIIFITFTFYPPHLMIFLDSNTFVYGI